MREFWGHNGHEAVLEEVRDLSREAAEHLAAEVGVGFVGPRPRGARRRKR